MPLHNVKSNKNDSIFGNKFADKELPKDKLPKTESDPDTVLEIVKDELFLDGNARQNLATFCQTWEEKQVHELMDISINKNLIDKDEYPQTAEIERRCVAMVANLWNAPKDKEPIGTSGIGSSEACMLGGMAMLERWKERRKAAGKPYDKPNLVCGPVQVVWEKFCRYWDVEIRQVPMEEDRFYMDADSMLKYIDENTIGVVTTFGLTFTGAYEPVKELSDALDKLYKTTGLDVQMHVDAASGGFLAPFIEPGIIWDFRVPRVKSISASGHKFGLAPLGAGWVVWRDKSELPEKLIFHVNYLGGDMPVFQINFSRPAGQIISQYYLFLRLGMEGYRKIHQNCYDTAQYIAKEIEGMGYFDLINDGDPKKGIPATTWKFKKGVDLGFNLYDLADKLRVRGWQVPAYSLPANAQDVIVQRVLIRQGFGRDMAALMIQDLKNAVEELKAHNPEVSLDEKSGGFKHT
ncbi:glutamate decarboxylase [Mycoplasma seminis]|uniref:Glutamate decarboxylase n=1 Tax=Mycoplasma seminis TaxID=512749 RepID=A0ABY9HA74_9MOLU|nr:glutamate decarboxylase [Mycoplasma seminis]WLP85490.1 glutamate decarboxylase [Mycoplasma seminis]